MVTSTNLPEVQVRPARRSDVGVILAFIHDLAAFENAPDQVETTEAGLLQWLFGKQRLAEATIAEYRGQPVAYAVHFYTFDTFAGTPGVYVQDLFVKEEFRGMGIGRMIMAYLAKLAKERGCGRLEWTALNWNVRAISFYRRLGAVAEDEWTGYGVSGEALDKLASTR